MRYKIIISNINKTERKLKNFKRLSTGINSPGGKWRILIEVLIRMPYHEYYLEPFLGCYDKDTEILTRDRGWILFKDLTMEDNVACLSTKHKMYWHKPLDIQDYHYNGKMIKLNHRSIDLLITPNHNLYLRETRKNYEFMKADNILYQNLRCINSVDWDGKEQKWFYLPILNIDGLNYEKIYDKSEEKWKDKKWLEHQYNDLKKSQNQIAIECDCVQGTIEYWMNKFNIKSRSQTKSLKLIYEKGMRPSNLNEINKLKMNQWLRFLGWYISEGFFNLPTNSVYICQKKEEYLNEIKECIMDLGYNFSYNGKRFLISNQQLTTYLKKLGKAPEKHIPQEFMNLSKRQLKILFDALIKGDGHISKEMISYYTSSKKLADQIQELGMKIGFNSSVKIRDRTKERPKIRGREIKIKHLSYEIYFRNSKECTLRRNRHFSIENYIGEVYCCTVPEHIILVRRNGKVVWCGNSGLVGINKPRCRYEVFNDKYYEIYNYFYVLKYHYEEFRKAKRGIFELVCEKCYSDIKEGIIKPKDRIERAVIFRYMNKLTRAGLNQLIKSDFRDMLPPTNSKKNVIEKVKKDYKNLLFKGIRVNNTRPYTNNDNGLITPIDFKVIENLQYVTLTCKDFRKAYEIFHKKYHIERNLSEVCFMYWDPEYPGKEHSYYHKFEHKDHLEVINILSNTPFKFELSIGGNCEFYLDAFKDIGYRIDSIPNKYSTNAKHQKEIIEYIIMNYKPEELPQMIKINEQLNLMNFS